MAQIMSCVVPRDAAFGAHDGKSDTLDRTPGGGEWPKRAQYSFYTITYKVKELGSGVN